MGFEPTRAEPIGLAVQCLNHSAIPTLYVINQFQSYLPTCAARVRKTEKNNKCQNHIFVMYIFFGMTCLTKQM